MDWAAASHGTIAGAGIVLDEAVRRMVAAGIDPATVIASTTEVAARSLGRTVHRPHRRRIVGRSRVVDEDWNPRRVWIGGAEVDIPGPAS